MKPYYEHRGIAIYHGDCLEVMRGIDGVDALISDPPYGMRWSSGGLRVGKNGHGITGSREFNSGDTIEGDDQPFDPSPFLDFPHVVLFGSDHFAQRLPVGTTLAWIKRLDGAFGSFLSDAEIAWMKGGHGVYCYRDLSMMAEAKTKTRKHPSQKPIPLFRWCIEKAGGNGLILDPFMGSGTTLVAAKQLGRKAIGIEIAEKYCEIAAKRLEQEVMDFSTPEPRKTDEQLDLLGGD